MADEQLYRTEQRFLSGVGHKMEHAKGRLVRGQVWQRVERDEADHLRALMAQHGKYSRELLSKAPKNPRVEFHGFERRWIFRKKRVSVVIVSVVYPMEWHVTQEQTDRAGPAITARQLMEHIESLRRSDGASHVIAVCSPSGFTPDAVEIATHLDHPPLVLVQPKSDGGWQVDASETLDPRLLDVFDPEDQDDRKGRVYHYLDQNSGTLLTGGLSVDAACESLGLGKELVQQAFIEYAHRDPELYAAQYDGEFFLYHGAADLQQEKSGMSMVDRIRQLFSREGDEKKKINELSQRRAFLSHRRDRFYDEIAQLEKREAELLEQGKSNKSQVARRRIAAQVAQLRKDIQRQNATAGMLNKQINILSTDIHNLTLIQQGETAKLPTTEELTQNAVAAEELMESLNADADLVGQLETGIQESLTTDEELAILREFEQSDETTTEAPDAETEQRKASGRATPAEQRYEQPTQDMRSAQPGTKNKDTHRKEPEAG